MFQLKETRNMLKGKMLLYVEDDIYIQGQLINTLRKLDIVVDTANDGKEGLQKALVRNYDIILTDYIMPHMSGIEMVNNLRKAQLEVPVIVISAFNDDGFMDKCASLKVSSILRKPTSINKLLEELVKVLRKPKD